MMCVLNNGILRRIADKNISRMDIVRILWHQVICVHILLNIFSSLKIWVLHGIIKKNVGGDANE